MNECELLSRVCGEAQCVNSEGSFFCTCPAGQDFNGQAEKCEPTPTGDHLLPPARINNTNIKKLWINTAATSTCFVASLLQFWALNCSVVHAKKMGCWRLRSTKWWSWIGAGYNEIWRPSWHCGVKYAAVFQNARSQSQVLQQHKDQKDKQLNDRKPNTRVLWSDPSQSCTTYLLQKSPYCLRMLCNRTWVILVQACFFILLLNMILLKPHAK